MTLGCSGKTCGCRQLAPHQSSPARNQHNVEEGDGEEKMNEITPCCGTCLVAAQGGHKN